MQITTTPRLTLRELTVDDAQHFYELNLDPEVLQFTGDVVFETVEAARQFLANYGHYKKYGYGGGRLSGTRMVLFWASAD